MVTVAKGVCDVCREESDTVDECMVVYNWQDAAPWGVDLCEECYEDVFGDLFEVGHPVKRANVRPQYRIVETEVTEEQLDGLMPDYPLERTYEVIEGGLSKQPDEE